MQKMSNNHPKHARNFTPHPINKHQRPIKPRFDANSKSTNTRSSPSHQDLKGISKRSTQSSSNAQPELQEVIKSASSNPYSIGLDTFPKLPKFKLISKTKHDDNKRPASADQSSPLATASKAADVVKPLPPNCPPRSSILLRHGPLLPRKPHQQAFRRPPWHSQQPSSSRPGRNNGDLFPTHNTRPEEENVPDKLPKKRTRTIRRKKGAAVSTEPTKTRRTGQTVGNGQTAGGVSLAEDEHEDTDEELYRIKPSTSHSNTSRSISTFASRNRFAFSTASIENDGALNVTPFLDKMVIEPSRIPGLSSCPAEKVTEGTPIPGLAGSSAKIVIGGPAPVPTTRPTCAVEMGIEITAPVPTRATSLIKMASETPTPIPACEVSPVNDLIETVAALPIAPPSTEKTKTETSASNPSAAKIVEEKPVSSLKIISSPSKIIAKATAPLASKPSTAHFTVQQPPTSLSLAKVKQASKIIKPSAPEIVQEDRHDTSSLSSISSESEVEVSSSEQESESSASEGSSTQADSTPSFHTIQWQPPLPTLEEEQSLFPDLVDGLGSFHHHQVVETAAQAGIIPPPPSPAPGILMDEASELGEDVCLEYTDFGECHEMGVPVTWSDSDYGEREESEGTDEFAELLLMEASDEKMMEINHLAQESAEPHSSDTEFFEYDGLFSDSSASYMAIQDFEPTITTLRTEEEAAVEEGEERDSNDESDGDTTDSLDEDDHSGLVRFGIEADDDDAEDDSTFFDLPPDSALGSLLTNLERSGDVEFFVLPEDPAPSQQSISPACLFPSTGLVSTGPAPQRATEMTNMSSIQLPLMGSFAIGSNAGRTIIDGKAVPPPSPFSGTKVIRYNRFKKLRDRSCAGDSEPSSLGTPKADSQAGSLAAHPGELSAAEEEFDITAFIHEDEVGDDNGEPAEAGCGDVAMKDLSKWRRVPMSAFRRNMMAASCSGWISEPVFDGAIIQPSRHTTVGHNLRSVQERKQHAKTLLMSPGDRHKRRRRRRSSKQPIGMTVGSLGGGTEEDRGDGTRLEHHMGVGLIEKEFDTPLFKSVMTEMGNHDMPMLNLMDGLEGLPIE